jgi:hypothetical protein
VSSQIRSSLCLAPLPLYFKTKFSERTFIIKCRSAYGGCYLVCLFIFLASIHLACVIQQKDVKQWFAELSVDMEKVRNLFTVYLSLHMSYISVP